MAIIYTYPIKATPILADTVIITDTESEDPENRTKQTSIASIKNTINVVDSFNSLKGDVTITGGTNITLTPSSNNIEINSTGGTVGPGTINKIPYFNSSNSLVDTTITYDSAAPGYNFGAASVITAYQLFPSNILDQDGEVGSANQVLTAGGSGGSIIWAAATGTTYTAGDGLDLTGTVFSTDLKANGGLVIESTELAIDLGATLISGTLAVSDGGTGLTTLTANGLLVGSGTSAITADGAIKNLSDASKIGNSYYIGTIPPGSPEGQNNIVVGSTSGSAITSGGFNTLIGTTAGNSISEGGNNTVIGASAGSTLTTTNNNTLVGHSADVKLSSTTEAVSIGFGTSSGSKSVSIGHSATAQGASGGIAIGNGAATTTNNLSLGSSSTPLVTSEAVGAVANYLEVIVNGTTYYIPLHSSE